VFAPDGKFLFSWGEGLFTRPHGLWIDSHDMVYCTDDLGHTVSKFTLDGKRLWMLGTQGQPSDTGATSIDYRTVRYAGPPFHFPTNLATGPNGELYVSDGYGNARVHKYSADGKLLFSWGEPGAGPGQFHVPHGIAVDSQGIVFVADRENSRLQLFSPEGTFLEEWTDIARPCELVLDKQDNVYVAELGYKAGMWPGTSAPTPDATGGRVSIYNRAGQLLERFGGGNHPTEPGDFYAPHDIWLDSHGDFYLAEVVRSAARHVRPAVGDYHTLQKFVRLES
jgi:DNA-binding beta-propeller fold protein YncE